MSYYEHPDFSSLNPRWVWWCAVHGYDPVWITGKYITEDNEVTEDRGIPAGLAFSFWIQKQIREWHAGFGCGLVDRIWPCVDHLPDDRFDTWLADTYGPISQFAKSEL